MKKRLVGALFVMALWGVGAYALGIHHGKSGKGFELPSVKLSWPTKEEPKQAEVKETDFVQISNDVCNPKLDAEVKAETAAKK